MWGRKIIIEEPILQNLTIRIDKSIQYSEEEQYSDSNSVLRTFSLSSDKKIYNHQHTDERTTFMFE